MVFIIIPQLYFLYEILMIAGPVIMHKKTPDHTPGAEVSFYILRQTRYCCGFSSFAMASAHLMHFSFEMDAMDTRMPFASDTQ